MILNVKSFEFFVIFSETILSPFYGIPYIVFTVFVIFRCIKLKDSDFVKFIIKSPLYFSLFYFIWFLTILSIVFLKGAILLGEEWNIFPAFGLSLMTQLFVLPIAYIYVFFARFLYFILQKIGFIKPEQPQIISGNE
jgi:hypothetical protein